MADTIRLVHCSDIHVSAASLEWRAADWFLQAADVVRLNHRLGRARRFALAEEILARARDDWHKRGVDHIVFSGDATALGFESEVRRAAECLGVGQASLPGLAVPGNHDYCTVAAASSGHFERWFAPWQQGRRIGNNTYPFAQAVGPVWLIGVNAATGNRLPIDASGTVGASQLERLRQLLGSLPADAVKILVVHFPICIASGQPESYYHGLRDLDALLAVANAGGVSLWLHGHRHRPYHFAQAPGATFPAICAGAATQHGIWSHGEYTIAQSTLSAVRRVYDPEGQCFRDVETFTFELKNGAAPA